MLISNPHSHCTSFTNRANGGAFFTSSAFVKCTEILTVFNKKSNGTNSHEFFFVIVKTKQPTLYMLLLLELLLHVHGAFFLLFL